MKQKDPMSIIILIIQIELLDIKMVNMVVIQIFLDLIPQKNLMDNVIHQMLQ